MGEDRLGASQLKGDRPKLKGEDCSPLRADSGEGPRLGSATSLSQAEVVSHPVCSSQPLCGEGDTDCDSQSVSLRASVAGPQSLKGECSDGECAASVDSTTHVRRRPSTRRRDSAEREERDIPPVRKGELDSEPGADAGRSPACPPAMLVLLGEVAVGSADLAQTLPKRVQVGITADIASQGKAGAMYLPVGTARRLKA